MGTTGLATCASHRHCTWASNSSDTCLNDDASPAAYAPCLAISGDPMVGDAESTCADAVTASGANLSGSHLVLAKRLVKTINALSPPVERAGAMDELRMLCEKSKEVHAVIEDGDRIGPIAEALNSQA